MPSPSTWPKGVKPWESSEEPLSFRLMKSCVVRVLAPAVAKRRVPGLLDWVWGASGMGAFSQAAVTGGLALRPKWTTKVGTRRKKGAVVKEGGLTGLEKRAAPGGGPGR